MMRMVLIVPGYFQLRHSDWLPLFDLWQSSTSVATLAQVQVAMMPLVLFGQYLNILVLSF